MTGIELIRRSLRLIGALGVGENPTDEEASDCLTALNQLMASWSLSGLTVTAKVKEKFTKVPGLPYFTWGKDGDFDSERPDKIFRAYIKHPDGTSFELSKLETEFYDAIADKNGMGVPDRFFYSQEFPLGKVYLYPNPDMAYEFEFTVLKKIIALEFIDDELMIPPGWDRALAYNLAIEIAPEFGATLSEAVVQIAMDSLSQIKRINVRPILSQTEIPAMSEISYRGWSINKGE